MARRGDRFARRDVSTGAPAGLTGRIPDSGRTARSAWLRQLTLGALLAAGTWLAHAAAPAPPPPPAPTAPATEAGQFPLHNFESSEYGASPQNWSVTQGPDGVIYVGNVSDGVLAFDGSRWRRAPVPNQAAVRSLATAPDGRIYVGTVGDFGTLERDADGQPRFVSMLDKVPVDQRDFADVWTTFVTADGVYFSTTAKIFRLHQGRITVIHAKTTFHFAFAVRGKLYIREVGVGLMRVDGDALSLVPDGGRFADERIYALLPWPGSGSGPAGMLVGTRAHGWFTFDGAQFRPWPTAAGDILNAATIYGAVRLTGGRIAIATLRSGLFILDRHGRLLAHRDRTTGLGSNVINALFVDRQHGLWLATNDGISRIDVDSPLTGFHQDRGLQGVVIDVIRHAGTLYAGTSEGLFRLTHDPGGNAVFAPVRGIVGGIWSSLSMDGQLLFGGDDGVYLLQPDGTARQLLDAASRQRRGIAELLLRSRQQPARVFVAYQNGVGSLRWTGSRWLDEGLIRGVPWEAKALEQDDAGHLWMGLWKAGIARLTLPHDWSGPTDPRGVQVDTFDAKAGLPPGQPAVATIDGHVRFLTSAGIERFDPATRRFTPDPDYAGMFPDGPRQISAVQQAPDGTLWMYTENAANGIKESGRAKRVDGHWQWRVTPLQPLEGIGMLAIWNDPGGAVWFGGFKGLYRYDPTWKSAPAPEFHALIRDVTPRVGHVPWTAAAPRIPYAQNALRFEFSAPQYDDFAANRFQVMLEGLDQDWSPWAADAFRDYTNLREGNYRFRVRARDIFGDTSAVATFAFRILPPWYRTWWAWTLWILAGVLLVALVVRWRSTALRRRNRALSALVAQRTAALQASNARLAEQSVTDPLTGLKNRRFLYEHIEQDLAIARRHGHDRLHGRSGLPQNSHVLFLMLDVDHFKEINDTHGHAAGDRLLVQLCDVLVASVRDADIAVRWGGEEFLIVARFALPDAGPQFAERLRTAVAGHRFDLGEGRYVRRTCSIGFAGYPACDDAPDRLGWEQVVNLADECMYAAKDNGRNAWAGVLPLAIAPEGSIVNALRTTLAHLPEPGPLPVAASWLTASRTPD